MDEEWPDHFEERSRPSSTRVEEEGARKHDAMANMVARPQSLQDYLREQLGWWDLDEPTRQMAERIIYNLDPNGYVQGRLEDAIDPNAGPDELALGASELAARAEGEFPTRARAAALVLGDPFTFPVDRFLGRMNEDALRR